MSKNKKVVTQIIDNLTNNDKTLFEEARSNFQNFTTIDLNYRKILAVALALVYRIFMYVDEQEIIEECERHEVIYDSKNKLKIILELCLPKPEEKKAQKRYKVRLRTYARALRFFSEKKVHYFQVEKQLNNYGIEYYANPREKSEEEINKSLENNDEKSEDKHLSNTSKSLSERTIKFFEKNKITPNRFVLFVVGNNVTCSDDEELIEKLKKYQNDKTYRFSNIDNFNEGQ